MFARSLVINVALFGTGVLVGSIVLPWVYPTSFPDGGKQVRTNQGVLTNPLLGCEVAQDTIAARKANFKPALNGYIEEVEKRTGIQEVAVQYRDLNNGPTFGYRNNEPFIPASLLKVSIAMSLLKRAEYDAEFLNRKIVFDLDKKVTSTQHIIPETTLEVGRTYSVQELLERMITLSDNQALVLLWDVAPLAEYESLTELLGIDPKVLSDPHGSLSVKEYGSFFRILFNSSFLTEPHSEYLLTLLTNTAFKSGIRAGIPEGITVAHKFGERTLTNGGEQFHDCGIVYLPQRPFLLCIMTRGSDVEALQAAIRDIATFTYREVINR